MEPENISVQKFLNQTCIDCEKQRQFELNKSLGGSSEAVYECEVCGHEVMLDLDPVGY